ncbi:hypothetical protein [Rhizomonospora bruguierae]|uniref:hypothetical protein n=1 Tax=Rhizomonospora bruguierae TaxID=1581705 RepID=UPI001BCF98AA|nr:hypothetical protein [Micromonospora sp. NBRC 107566]
MDALGRLAAPAGDLFARVDAALIRAGAPEEHPIWPLLRRVGALPGEAVAAVVALRPGGLTRAAAPLRGLAEEYERAATTGARAAGQGAPGRGAAGHGAGGGGAIGDGWSGAGADAFAGHWSSLAGHLAGPEESLAARLRATAGYAEAVADWMADTRAALAAALAEALGSAEAVALVTAGRAGAGVEASVEGGWPGGQPPPPGAAVRAAATLGARALAAIDAAYDGGERLRGAWSTHLVELRYRAPASDGPPPPNALRVPL